MALPSQYASVAELQAAPLGLSLTNVGKTTGQPLTGAQVYAALTNLLMSASSAADNCCQQSVSGSQNVETALSEQDKAWIDREGILWFRTNNSPILYPTEFKYGFPSSNGPAWVPVSPLTQCIIMGRNIIGAPLYLPQRGWPRLQVSLTYVNGYANSFLAAAAVAGASSISVSDVAGFMAGKPLTIFDSGNTETVEVSDAYTPPTLQSNGVPTPGAVALASPLVYDHTPVPASSVTGTTQPYDIRVSSVPFDFTWAVLLIAKSFIQERGTSSLVMGSTAGVRGRTEIRISTDDIPTEAKLTLNNYRLVT